MSFAVPEWMIKPSGYVCENPTEYEFESEARLRNCGWCARCLARKKRDLATRAGAEAMTSKEVVTWTLTYRPGEAGAVDFETKDRQTFLKRVRRAFWRSAAKQVGAPNRIYGVSSHVRAYWNFRINEVMPKVRYLGCGERGERFTKRCHWHIEMFLTGVSGWVSTPKTSNGKPGRQLHDLWPHGVVNIHVIHSDQPHLKVASARYSAKYLDKSRRVSKRDALRGLKPAARLFRSTRTPLGYDYLCEQARETARQSAPLHAKYRVPGVCYSKGPKAGRMTENVVSGRMRDHWIQAYREEWERVHPDRPVPMTEFMMAHDPDAVARPLSPMAAYAKAQWVQSLRSQLVGHPETVVPVIPDLDRRGWLMVTEGPSCLGVIEMKRSGWAIWSPQNGPSLGIPEAGFRALVYLSAESHDKIEAWLAEKRGPDWVHPEKLRALRMQKARDQMRAVQRFAKRAPPVDDKPYRVSPDTALHRKMAHHGESHIPGVDVVSFEEGWQVLRPRGVTKLRRPVAKRHP